MHRSLLALLLMAFPVTITSTAFEGASFNQRTGPFDYSGKKFVVLNDFTGTANLLQVWYSSDSGNTWSHADAANDPTIDPDHFYTPGWGNSLFDCAASGQYIYVYMLGPTVGGFPMAAFKKFDMGASPPVWVAGTTTSALIVESCDYQFLSGGVFLAPADFAATTVLGNRRADGHHVIVTSQYQNNVALWGGVAYSIYDGSAWSTPAAMADTDAATTYDKIVGVVGDGSNRVLVLWLNSNIVLRGQVIKSDGTLSAAFDVANDVYNPDGTSFQHSMSESIGLSAFDSASGQWAIPYKNTSNHLKVALATAADAPTFSAETVDASTSLFTSSTGQSGLSISSACYSSGKLFVLYVDSSINVNYRSRISSGNYSPKALFVSGSGRSFQYGMEPAALAGKLTMQYETDIDERYTEVSFKKSNYAHYGQLAKK